MWKGDEYVYITRDLRAIATNYKHIYQCIEFRPWRIVFNPYSLVEYKADFDRALDGIGRGHWVGDIENRPFKDFRYFGKLQKLVIADIYSVPYWDIGIHYAEQLYGRAYGTMCRLLNGT